MNLDILSTTIYTTSDPTPSVGLILLVLFSIYFLPSIIALIKRNNRTKVILFNFFLGWTFVMWIISLVWACKKPQKPMAIPRNSSPADELKKYKELLDAGVITEEEFN